MPADYDEYLEELAERRNPEGLRGVGMGVLEYAVLPEVDSASMSARFRICTPRVDREGDIIEPSGVDWTDYQFAPVVKYEHGFTGIPWPIARSADDGGNLHVFYGGHDQDDGQVEDALYARAFFSERHELSDQVFALIDDGFLRAASIHVIPTPGCFTIRPDESCHARKSSLMEWSVCSVAMNPDSYAKSLQKESSLSELLNLQLESASRILERGSLGNRKLLPSIAKCLTAVQPPKQPLVRGHKTIEDEMKKTLTQTEVEKLSFGALAKALADSSEYDVNSVKLLRSKAKMYDEEMVKLGDETDESLPKAGEMGDEESTQTETEGETEAAVLPESTSSPGADFLASVHAAISDLVAKLDAASTATEKPEVLDFAAEFAGMLRTELTAAEGAYSSIYPEAPALSSAAVEPADAEMVKSWIAGSSRNAYKIEGLSARLAKAMSANPKQMKAAIASTVRDLQLLNSQAKSWKPAATTEAVTAERFNRLVATVGDLIDAIAKSPA